MAKSGFSPFFQKNCDSKDVIDVKKILSGFTVPINPHAEDTFDLLKEEGWQNISCMTNDMRLSNRKGIYKYLDCAPDYVELQQNYSHPDDEMKLPFWNATYGELSTLEACGEEGPSHVQNFCSEVFDTVIHRTCPYPYEILPFIDPRSLEVPYTEIENCGTIELVLQCEVIKERDDYATFFKYQDALNLSKFDEAESYHKLMKETFEPRHFYNGSFRLNFISKLEKLKSLIKIQGTKSYQDTIADLENFLHKFDTMLDCMDG